MEQELKTPTNQAHSQPKQEDSNQESQPKERYSKKAYQVYKEIALEWILNRYIDIQAIYSKYHPKASVESLDSAAYRMLGSVRFQLALKEVWEKVRVEEINTAKEVYLSLRKEMFTALKASDRISAASWLGKTEAMFTDKSQVEVTQQLTEDTIQAIKQLETNKQAFNRLLGN